MRHLDARHGLEELAREMARGAHAGGGEGQAPRMRPRVGDEVEHALRRHRRMDDQQAFGLEHQRDRREIAHRVVGHRGKEADVDGVGAEAARDQRVAVGRGLGDRVGADVAPGAGAVLDQHRLSPALGHACADEARIEVGDAARRERHHDLDGLRGIGM